MDKVRLGRTGVEVSVAGLGCGGSSRLGMARGGSVDDAARLVATAIDLGVTFIDTAALYGTEEAVGRGVKGRRDEVFISTKATPHRAPSSSDAVLPVADLLTSLDASLRRLGLEQVDLFHLHGVRPGGLDFVIQEAAPALETARAAGKFRFLGITEHFGSDTAHLMLPRAIETGLFDVVMVGHNLINPSARTRVFPVSRAHDVATLIMFAVRRALSQPGALREVVDQLIAAGQIDADLIDRNDPLDFLAADPAVASVIEAAYRFCRHEPGATVVLTGTGSIDHLKANIAAIQAPRLPDRLLARLDRIFGRVDSISGN